MKTESQKRQKAILEDRNEQFRIMQFKSEGEHPHDCSIYLLNVGDCFQGFGGSSTGLVVRKTASMIVRDMSVMGCVDTEYDVHHKETWRRIFHAIQAAK